MKFTSFHFGLVVVSHIGKEGRKGRGRGEEKVGDINGVCDLSPKLDSEEGGGTGGCCVVLSPQIIIKVEYYSKSTGYDMT